MPETAKRLLASYGRRRGRRLRPSRQGLMDGLLPELQLTLEEVAKWQGGEVAKLFLPCHPATPPLRHLYLEIGFGGGEHLAHQAALNPDVGIIGCEPFINGIAALLALLTIPSPASAGGLGRGQPLAPSPPAAPLPNPPPRARERGLSNVRIFNGDARLLMEKLPDGCLDKAFILYPDPWPKARHHKRRLISTEFLHDLARLMKPGAELRLATDHSDYCTWMLEQLLSHPGFTWTAKICDDWQKPWPDWISTRYEQKRLAGMPTYLSFKRV